MIAPESGGKIYGYIRVSTEKQEDSAECQAGRIAEKVATLDGHFNTNCVDEATSGFDTKFREREGAKQLLDLVERGDVVVTTELSRLGRGMVDIVTTVGMFQELGVRLVCLNFMGQEVDTTTPIGAALVAIFAALSQLEAQQCRTRTKAALQHRKKLGLPYHGRPVPGHDLIWGEKEKRDGRHVRGILGHRRNDVVIEDIRAAWKRWRRGEAQHRIYLDYKQQNKRAENHLPWTYRKLRYRIRWYDGLVKAGKHLDL